MTDQGWKRKADALLRLANDQAGKPEGELAREMLRRLISRHPDITMAYKPMREFAMSDVGFMLRNGIETGGSWTGRNLNEAISIMIADYRTRIERFKDRPIGLLN